jgi:pilus assembly protein CpaF
MALGRFTLKRAPAAPPPGTMMPAEFRNGAQAAGASNGADAMYDSSPAEERRLDVKLRIHRKLIDEINLTAVDKIPEKELRSQVYDLVAGYVGEEKLPLNAAELEQFVGDIINEMTGLGPIEPLLADDTITDILINTHKQIYIERRGQLELSAARFKDETHLLRIINKIVSTVGRRVDETQPMCDARLPDGSRVNVAIRPISVDGPLVSIRKFSKRPLSMERLISNLSISREMADLLAAAVKGRITILVSGGTGSGKTTMLNALSSYIQHAERLITIEDAAELQLQQPHVGRMETRPPNLEGKGEIRQRELVKNALRMRPDRIIVGEVRGEEAFDMLQAMNTGHEGSMTTIHANTPRDSLSRLEQMVGMAGFGMSQLSIRSQIASAIRLIVQLNRLSDGRRRVVSITEITGVEGDVVQLQEIFKFNRVSTEDTGEIVGHYAATGVRPKFLGELATRGLVVPPSHFDPTKQL